MRTVTQAPPRTHLFLNERLRKGHTNSVTPRYTFRRRFQAHPQGRQLMIICASAWAGSCDDRSAALGAAEWHVSPHFAPRKGLRGRSAVHDRTARRDGAWEDGRNVRAKEGVLDID